MYKAKPKLIILPSARRLLSFKNYLFILLYTARPIDRANLAFYPSSTPSPWDKGPSKASRSRVCFYERELAERKRWGILGHPNVVRRTPVAVSSGLAHHVNKGHQGVISCLPPLTTCPHSTLWRTQEHELAQVASGRQPEQGNLTAHTGS